MTYLVVLSSAELKIRMIFRETIKWKSYRLWKLKYCDNLNFPTFVRKKEMDPRKSAICDYILYDDCLSRLVKKLFPADDLLFTTEVSSKIDDGLENVKSGRMAFLNNGNKIVANIDLRVTFDRMVKIKQATAPFWKNQKQDVEERIPISYCLFFPNIYRKNLPDGDYGNVWKRNASSVFI
jgi:hypothetical protein